MDRLSYCPSLPQILSYVTPEDVITCLRLNKRINSVVTNNWRTMKKPAVNISFKQHYKGGCITVTINRLGTEKDTLRITSFGVMTEKLCSPLFSHKFAGLDMIGNYLSNEHFCPLLISKLGEFKLIQNAESVRQLLEFVLPRIKLTSVVFLETHFTRTESDAVFESIRDFCDDVRVSIFSSKINQLQNRLLEHWKERRTSHIVSQGGESLSKSIIRCYRHVSNPIRMTTTGSWNAKHIQMIIECWKEGALKSKYIRLDSTDSNFKLQYAETAIWMTSRSVSAKIDNWGGAKMDWQFSVSRQLDEKTLHVRNEGTSLVILEFQPLTIEDAY